MSFRKEDNAQTAAMLAKGLTDVAGRVSKMIEAQVDEYIASLDEGHIPTTPGDIMRFADSAHIHMNDEFHRFIMGHISAKAARYSRHYSKCAARIDRLIHSAPSLELDDALNESIERIRRMNGNMGKVDYILQEAGVAEGDGCNEG